MAFWRRCMPCWLVKCFSPIICPCFINKQTGGELCFFVPRADCGLRHRTEVRRGTLRYAIKSSEGDLGVGIFDLSTILLSRSPALMLPHRLRAACSSFAGSPP